MELATRYNPREIEERLYKWWEESKFFHAQLHKNPKGPYCIMIPPPNVTGILHMGHGLDMTLQDIVIRFKRMQGFDALWLPGCDHAGIATEMKVKDRLRKEGKTKHDLGREAFIKEMWNWKEQFGGTIMHQLRRLGCSLDWDRERFTLDEGLSRAVREVFVRLYEKGLAYRGKYIVNWCPGCVTAISDIEVEREDQNGSLWYVRYPFAEGRATSPSPRRGPETILADVAIAVNPRDERYQGLIGKKVNVPVCRPRNSGHRRRHGGKGFRHRRAQDYARARPDRLPHRPAHNLPAPSVIDEQGMMNDNAPALQRHGPVRMPQGIRRGPAAPRPA